MATINFQFETAKSLSDFTLAKSTKLFKVDMDNLRLSCNCSDSDISVAKELGATVIKSVRFIN